jgi:hypothetical protein
VALYIHSTIHLHGLVLDYLSTVTTLPYLYLKFRIIDMFVILDMQAISDRIRTHVYEHLPISIKISGSSDSCTAAIKQ